MEEDFFGNADQQSRVSPDVHVGLALLVREVTAKRRDVVYPIQVAWIDAELFVTRQVELFSRRGRPLKRLSVSEFQAVGDKMVAVRLEMSDFMKRDSRTVFAIESIAVDEPVDEAQFSLEELTF